MPPLSGFFAKLSLVRAGLDVGQYVIVAVALAVGILTLFSMLKIWAEAFWKSAPEAEPATEYAGTPHLDLRDWLFPIAFLAAITVLIGLGAGPAFNFALQAGEQLMDPSAYIQAVMGGAR
jgi:multicomponent Na+:H+ antiporter subunit D